MDKEMSRHGVKIYHIGKNNPKTGVITVACCPDAETGDLRIGISSCSPKDRFIKSKGRSIAMSRMCRKPIFEKWDKVHSAETVAQILNDAHFHHELSTRWAGYVFTNNKNKVIADKPSKQKSLPQPKNDGNIILHEVVKINNRLKKFFVGNTDEENRNIRPSNQSVMTIITSVTEDGNSIKFAYSCAPRKKFCREAQTKITMNRLEKTPFTIPFTGHSSQDFSDWFNKLSKDDLNKLVPKAWHNRKLANIPQTGLTFVSEL